MDKKELYSTLEDLRTGQITSDMAMEQLLLLFSFMQRSEQLVCDKCLDGLNKSKSFEKGTCVHCRDKV